MTIRQVILTSGQNLKPPFLCQYLIFFNDFFFTLEISFGSLLKPKNRILKNFADQKAFCNLNIIIPEVMKTGSANLNFLCNFSQLPLSNITLFTVLFTVGVIFFFFLPGPRRRRAPVLKCRRFFFFQSYIVRDISLT